MVSKSFVVDTFFFVVMPTVLPCSRIFTHCITMRNSTYLCSVVVHLISSDCLFWKSFVDINFLKETCNYDSQVGSSEDFFFFFLPPSITSSSKSFDPPTKVYMISYFSKFFKKNIYWLFGVCVKFVDA